MTLRLLLVSSWLLRLIFPRYPESDTVLDSNFRDRVKYLRAREDMDPPVLGASGFWASLGLRALLPLVGSLFASEATLERSRLVGLEREKSS